jgi:hypothetical protein
METMETMETMAEEHDAPIKLDETEMFNIIKEKLTEDLDLYDWMKRQFSDVCSSGDVVINELLDELKFNKEIQIKEEWMNYIIYVYNIYIENYLNGEDPDPFWAD